MGAQPALAQLQRLRARAGSPRLRPRHRWLTCICNFDQERWLYRVAGAVEARVGGSALHASCMAGGIHAATCCCSFNALQAHQRAEAEGEGL